MNLREKLNEYDIPENVMFQIILAWIEAEGLESSLIDFCSVIDETLDEETTDEELSGLLSLVMTDWPSPEEISTWSPEMKAQAETWAVTLHLTQEDPSLGQILKLLPKPEFL